MLFSIPNKSDLLARAIHLLDVQMIRIPRKESWNTIVEFYPSRCVVLRRSLQSMDLRLSHDLAVSSPNQYHLTALGFSSHQVTWTLPTLEPQPVVVRLGESWAFRASTQISQHHWKSFTFSRRVHTLNGSMTPSLPLSRRFPRLKHATFMPYTSLV